MKIRVTAKDIRLGVQADEKKCPIALALKRKFKTKNIEVECECVCVNGEVENMPNNAVRFIERFDSDSPVKPFTFELPIKSKRKGGK